MARFYASELYYFAIKYRSNDNKSTSEVCVSANTSYTNHQFSNLEPQIIIKKSRILIAIFFFAHRKVNLAAILIFFLFQFTFILDPQINHIVVNMFSGILTVAVHM